METKILNILFLALIVILFIFLVAIIMIGVFEKEEKGVGGLKDITGAMQSFEVFHETPNFDNPTKKVSQRYDDKYFEYLEHIKDRREKSFMR